VIKHATASVHLFHHDARHGWRTGLVKHPIFGRWLQPGGHVEADENPQQAALREAAEETGLASIQLLQLHRPLPVTQLNGGIDVALPLWIVEHPIERDNHLNEPHIHIDHKYAAVAQDARPVRQPDHPFGWFDRESLSDPLVFDDVRERSLLLMDVLTSRYSGELQENDQHQLSTMVARPPVREQHR
jgi:8-oxo-dGTP pyrophosphatase MutT (NUDIX family)